MIEKKIIFMSFDEVTTYTINDRAGKPLLHEEDPFYYISVNSVDGLDQADISYESHPIPNVTGEKSGDVFRRGRTITLSGNIYGRNIGKLEEGAEYLQLMFLETKLRKLKWTRIIDSIEVYTMCRVSQDLAVARNVQEGIYRFGWTIGLRADLPFTYRESDDALYPSWQT